MLTKADRDALRAAGYTSLFTLAGGLALALVGWLTQVAAWASSEGATPFPGAAGLAYGAVVVIVSAAGGILNAIVRLAQARAYLPGSGPAYSKDAATS